MEPGIQLKEPGIPLKLKTEFQVPLARYLESTSKIPLDYRKIPKISPGAYFWRGLSTKGNLRLKIDWATVIVGRKFTVFSFFYFVVEGNFQAPGGLIFGGAI